MVIIKLIMNNLSENKNIRMFFSHQNENIIFKNKLVNEIMNYIFNKSFNNILISENKLNIKAIKYEDLFIKKFNENKEYNRNIKKLLKLDENTECIAVKPLKKNGYKLKHTDSWNEYKKGTQEKSPSAKTDVVILNKLNKDILKKISLKSNEGRASSGDYFEHRSQLLSVFNNNKYNKLSKKNIILELRINIILNTLKKIGKHKSQLNKSKLKDLEQHLYPEYKKHFEWYNITNKYIEYINDIFNEIKKDNIQYIRDVIFECYNGKFKFGDNVGSADYLIILEPKSTEVKESMSLENYDENEKLKNHINKYINKNNNCYRYKSCNNLIWCVFL